MSTETSQIQQMKPYIILAAVLFVLLLVVIFWPTSEPAKHSSQYNVDSTPAEPIRELNEGVTDVVIPDVFEAPPKPSEVQISPNMEVDEFEAQEIVVDVPIDTSDATVKLALMSVASSPTFTKLLVNDRLIEKFVINVHNLASEELSPKDALVVPPEESFKTYQQADRTWIETASFQRYNTYVDALESVEVEDILEVFSQYEDTINDKFKEISRPGSSFDESLLDAIDALLDTPKVPVPIEVYSDSVMYKFKDPRLESLSGPQKQLIRTGPENMRRIKDVLRSLKTAIEERNE